VTNLPTNIEHINLNPSTGIVGNIANIPSLATYISINNLYISDYTAGKVWPANMSVVDISPTAGFGLTSTEVDNLLIDLALTTWTGSLQ